MRTMVGRAAIVVTLVVLANCVSTPSPTTGTEPVYTPDQLSEDLAVLQSTLRDLHPGTYLFTTKEEYELRFARAQAAVRGGATELESFEIVAGLVAQVNCGHTMVTPSEARLAGRESGGTYPPFTVRVFGDALYVAEVYPGHAGLSRGMEVLSINGVEAKTILDRVLPNLGSDGYITTSQPKLFELFFHDLYADYFGLTRTYRLECFNHTDVQVTTVTVAGITNDERLVPVAHGAEPEQVFAFELLDDPSDTAVMTVRSFAVKRGYKRFDRGKPRTDLIDDNKTG